MYSNVLRCSIATCTYRNRTRDREVGGWGGETVRGNKNSDGNCQLDTIMEMSLGEETGGEKCPGPDLICFN